MKTREWAHATLPSATMMLEEASWHEMKTKQRIPAIVREGSVLDIGISAQEWAAVENEAVALKAASRVHNSKRSMVEPSGHDEQRQGRPPFPSKHSPDPAEIIAVVTSLQGEVCVLHELRKSDQQIIAALAERVRQLEVELMPFLAEQEEAGEFVTNPHHRWIEGHMSMIREYPNQWVAIDPERGIVANGRNEDELAEKLDAMPDDVQAQLLAINTALYL